MSPALHIQAKPYPYRRKGNEWVREKRVDEVLNEEVDLFDILDGEEISTITVDASGATITSEDKADGIGTNSKLTFTITDVGTATFTIVTSGSRTLETPRFRWIGTDDDLDDYR